MRLTCSLLSLSLSLSLSLISVHLIGLLIRRLFREQLLLDRARRARPHHEHRHVGGVEPELPVPFPGQQRLRDHLRALPEPRALPLPRTNVAGAQRIRVE